MTAARVVGRVVVLTPSLASTDGIGRVSIEAVRALSEAGTSSAVDAWSLGSAQATDEPGQGVARTWSARGSRLRLASRVLGAAVRRPPSLAVAMHLHLAPLARILRCPYAVFLHGVEAWTALRPSRGRALERAGALVANSSHTAAEFRAKNPALAHRAVEVCPLGLPEEPPPASPAREEGRFALIVGRLAASERYKGHDLLLDVWPRVLARTPDVRLVVAGGGDDLERLRARAAGSGLGAHVVFLGPVEEARLHALYRDCEALVLPSTHEGFGLVFLEAMRAGKPCVGARGAAEEVVEHGVTGFVVEPARPETLVEALGRLFDDASLRERMGAAGRRRFRERFTAAAFRERFRRAVGAASQAAPCAG